MNISRKAFVLFFLLFGFSFLFLHNVIIQGSVRVLAQDWSVFFALDGLSGWKCTFALVFLPLKALLVGPIMPVLSILNEDPPPPLIALVFIAYWSVLALFLHAIGPTLNLVALHQLRQRLSFSWSSSHQRRALLRRHLP